MLSSEAFKMCVSNMMEYTQKNAGLVQPNIWDKYGQTHLLVYLFYPTVGFVLNQTWANQHFLVWLYGVKSRSFSTNCYFNIEMGGGGVVVFKKCLTTNVLFSC